MTFNNRKEERYPTQVNVKCSCRYHDECKYSDVPAMSINSSTSGMCIYTLASFEAGTHLIVDCKYNGYVKKNAVVKWCEEVAHEQIYRLGLSFGEK